MIYKLFFFLFLFGCAEYRIKKADNPFRYYGVRSVSVPMFINYSVFPQVSSAFTKEIFLELEGHSGLQVVSGERFDETDAVLIGVILSDQYLKNAKSSPSLRLTTGELKSSIGERQSFYLPAETKLSMSLRLILIKKPTQEEIKLLTHVYPENFISPRIIFDEVFLLSHTFSRDINATLSTDQAGVTNMTRNRGSIARAIKEMAKNSSVQFKELIINAF